MLMFMCPVIYLRGNFSSLCTRWKLVPLCTCDNELLTTFLDSDPSS